MRLIRYVVVLCLSLWSTSCISIAPVNLSPLPAPINDSPLVTWSPDGEMGSLGATVGGTTLKVIDGCLYLVLDNQRVILPIWPEPTSWDAATETVRFVSPEGEQIELQNGTRILAGGSSPSSTVEFVSPPNPTCEADEMFIISSVTAVQE